MKCAVCKQGETEKGKATVTLESGNATVVIKGVPADICGNCGEEYVAEKVTKQLLSIAEDAANEGVQINVREYAA